MKKFVRAVLIAPLLLFAIQSTFAAEWRGLTPLRSTRADVMRLLGQCSEHGEACVFSSAQEDVYILFSGGLGDEYQGCIKALPPETIMFIQVQPKARLKLEALGLNNKKLKRLKVFEQYKSDGKHYLTDTGLVLETFRGSVNRAVYIAALSDRYLCPSYYEQPEAFVASLAVHPPLIISIDCPKSAPAGTNLVLKAFASVDARHGPTWSVDAGKIVQGQHTYKITLDTTGLAARTILVTAELADTFGHAVMASCRIDIQSN